MTQREREREIKDREREREGGGRQGNTVQPKKVHVSKC